MKHVTILCVVADKLKALSKLSELNVLHVTTSITDSKSILDASLSVEEAVRAKNIMREASASKWDSLSFPPPLKKKSTEKNEIVAKLNELADTYLSAKEKKLLVDKEILKYKRWGDFDSASAKSLLSSDVPFSLFKINAGNTVPEFPDGISIITHSGSDGVFGALIGAELPQGLESVPLPQCRLSDNIKHSNELSATLKTISQEIKSISANMQQVDNEVKYRKRKQDYVTVRENMEETDDIAHISGFIDARKADKLLETAKDASWGVVSRDPEPEENVPTLLEPPRLFRPITALFDALGIMPGYKESDVSAIFFIFFSIFFAMLMGDVGYGFLIFIATFFIKRKTKKKSGGVLSITVNRIFSLFYVFACASICWGVATGVYFGIPTQALPNFLHFKSVAFLSDQNNIMQICFALGATHLSLARIWNTISLFPSTKMLAELGWVGVVWCMYCVICSIVIEGFVLPAWTVPAMVISVLFIAFFMLSRSELKTEGLALGMLPLNIISVMGDIISYVRLFAVGLASVKVAEAFNTMILETNLPLWIKIPGFIIILLLGHGLNIVMGLLSVLVHAVRLNTLEFSGAKGVSWSGTAFQPFQSNLMETEETFTEQKS